MSDELEALKQLYKKYGQEHVFNFYDELSAQEQQELVQELRDVDVADLQECWEITQRGDQLLDTSAMLPIDEDLIGSVNSTKEDVLQNYEELALRAISDGHIGVLLLAGGQGTRLGVPYPKGMYDIGLLSGKSLYQIQVERILRLEELAKRLTGSSGKITMYIMTSDHTKTPTQDYFVKHNYFGALPEQIKIFEQQTIPAFNNKGKFVLRTKYNLARSPDGNGGLYRALREEKILEDMDKKEIRYLHVYCVDNVLVKVADPRFMGFCISRKAEAGNKVIEKGWPSEPVGVVVRIEDKVQVVEYSEISKENSELREKDGRLTYRAGNICNHFFEREFLKRVCREHEKKIPYHVAKKAIPFVDPETGIQIKPDSPNGIKLEKFVFDVFQFSKSFVVWECNREEEFSPLKNGEGAAKDTPSTAREALYALHRRYLKEAGAIFSGGAQDAAELSPIVSYSGEGLEAYANQSINLPVLIS
ncbi:UDP-N-acetylhexosamine pyrophosphorylase-like protein 1 [Eurytemora carolleeae]|uniref:UDP-N-acetylhexosamine pyrophosphorylase-like protein 1 n=1 Tax=Eurytemora carolleeae TaxID=1294199 RepID=UPI000C777209|nr:UDP-N-acetylhexosamine pyrophosphorylase-like protein 1 [Eurytemora carolleeae]|eukprot:XP_023331233.1 UDP-N-acetylhexosamine pyrophosphorylase-like protein 1 [Eurytemora affinis]